MSATWDMHDSTQGTHVQCVLSIYRASRHHFASCFSFNLECCRRDDRIFNRKTVRPSVRPSVKPDICETSFATETCM